jgi:hypothetical protein
MNKQEIIEAIEATIVANGQKGITAESLANLLIEMVNATPEGGGNANYYTLSIGFGLDGSVPLTEEEKAHNAELYATLTALDPMDTINHPPVFVLGLPTYWAYYEGQLQFLLSFTTNMNSEGMLMGVCYYITLNSDGSIEVSFVEE